MINIINQLITSFRMSYVVIEQDDDSPGIGVKQMVKKWSFQLPGKYNIQIYPFTYHFDKRVIINFNFRNSSVTVSLLFPEILINQIIQKIRLDRF